MGRATGWTLSPALAQLVDRGPDVLGTVSSMRQHSGAPEASIAESCYRFRVSPTGWTPVPLPMCPGWAIEIMGGRTRTGTLAQSKSCRSVLDDRQVNTLFVRSRNQSANNLHAATGFVPCPILRRRLVSGRGFIPQPCIRHARTINCRFVRRTMKGCQALTA